MVNFIGEPVTRRRRVQDGVDRYGEPVYVTQDTLLPQRAAFDPGGERGDVVITADPTRDLVVTKPKLYFLRAVPDLVQSDRVIVRGLVYDIDAPPADWQDPFGSDVGGLVVELTRATG